MTETLPRVSGPTPMAKAFVTGPLGVKVAVESGATDTPQLFEWPGSEDGR